MAPFRLFYASDIHGSERCLLKFANAARFYKADAIVLGGDLTGKVLVPLVADGRGYRFTFLGQAERVESADELADAEKRIRLNGFYPYRCDPDEYERLTADEAYREALFEDLMRSSVARWVDMLGERLKGTGAKAYLMAGNDDTPGIDEVLAAVQPPLYWHDGRALPLGDGVVVGLSTANPTPWASPRELPEEALEARLETLLAEAGVDGRPLVLNTHVPPHNSGLDMAPVLREDLSVVRSGGEPELHPVGSTAVRRVIERHQPTLSLHGHVHESRGIARLGATIAINPGSEYGEGSLRGALVTLNGRRVVGHQLVAG